MKTEQMNEIIRRAMQNAKGDNLERAVHAFGGLSDKELDKQHGESGKTRRQILHGYQTHRNEWIEANAYLESLLA